MASGDDQEPSTTKKSTRRQPAKKQASRTSAEKQPAKRQPAKKQAAKRPTAKKQPAKKQPAATESGSADADVANEGSSSTRSERSASAPRAEGRRRASAADVGRLALSHVAGMTGNAVESITGLERTDDGWKVEVVAVELRRVPSTTDVLASYEVLLDSEGELEGYRRVERYSRGDTRSDQ